MANFILLLERKLAALYLLLLRMTIRFDVINQPSDSMACIYMFWHRNLLLLGLHRIGSPVVVAISASKDGELIAGPVEELGFIPVRGSSTRGGHKVLLEMVRLGKSHQLAITPDGPKGPPGTIHQGIFQISLMAKIPIIPVVADCSREWVFNSWDRFRLPKSFSRIKVIYGNQFYVNDKNEFQAIEAQIREEVKSLEESLLSSHK